MGNYLHVKLHALDQQQQELWIARLSMLGFEGFEEGEQHLSAFIAGHEFDADALDQLLQAEQIHATKEVVEERNWNEEWESNFEPVLIEGFCSIRAHFHPAQPDVRYDIVITPKMSFGTGHHATTYMMVTYLSELDLQEKSVLDFGTGTGILAILAEKMGAATIMAIDNDDWSINNAEENVSVNNCRLINLEKAESLSSMGTYDVIAANINKHVLLANMESMQQHLNKDGVLIVSGFLPGDIPDMLASAEMAGLKETGRKIHNNWAAMLLSK